MTIIAIGWTRGHKKALATILPTKYWEKLRNMPKFDYTDIAATHKIMKRDVDIAYIAMRKIHYNVMRFRDTVSLDDIFPEAHIGILTPPEPWSGTNASGVEEGLIEIRPWTKPENQEFLKNSKHPTVVNPPLYDDI